MRSLPLFIFFHKHWKFLVCDSTHLCYHWHLSFTEVRLSFNVVCRQNGDIRLICLFLPFLVSSTFMLYRCRVFIPHLYSAHGLFTHSSPSSLMLLFVKLNIEKLSCLSTASIFHAMAWLEFSQWNCADFRCTHRVN